MVRIRVFKVILSGWKSGDVFECYTCNRIQSMSGWHQCARETRTKNESRGPAKIDEGGDS